MIYLDYNATTPLADEVREGMSRYWSEEFGNASSGHPPGQRARDAIERARAQVAGLIGAQAEEIVFTPGGTFANNLAILGTFPEDGSSARGKRRLVISALEHPAVIEPARYLSVRGVEVIQLPALAEGIVDLTQLESAIDSSTQLVSVMHANNETGAIQPIEEIAAVCRHHGVPFHSDAAQSAGKTPIDVDAWGVDLLTLACHKFHGPKGIGALYVRRSVDLRPIVYGASQERGLAPGTENVPLIVGMGIAAELAARRAAQPEHLRFLRDRFEALLRETLGVACGFHAERVPRLPNTSLVYFRDVDAARLLARLPELCVSMGAACHSGSRTGSATLRAMGVTEEIAKGTFRVSLGHPTTEVELVEAATHLSDAWRAERGKSVSPPVVV